MVVKWLLSTPAKCKAKWWNSLLICWTYTQKIDKKQSLVYNNSTISDSLRIWFITCVYQKYLFCCEAEMDSNEGFDMKSCRICLSTKKPLCPLFRYKLSGNYAEMLTAIADVKVRTYRYILLKLHRDTVIIETGRFFVCVVIEITQTFYLGINLANVSMIWRAFERLLLLAYHWNKLIHKHCCILVTMWIMLGNNPEGVLFYLTKILFY